MTPATSPSRERQAIARARAAQRSVRSIDRARGAASAGCARHSSSTIAMSDPSCAWMSVAFSGVSRCAEPSRCDRKRAPSSSIVRAIGEAEHLVAAAVGEDRSGPADEAVQPAAPRDQVVAGPQIQMIGVAEQDLGAESTRDRGA